MIHNARINRLQWRSRRSMLELDLYFAKFIDTHGLAQLSSQQLDTYEVLLEMDDSDLLPLLQGKSICNILGL